MTTTTETITPVHRLGAVLHYLDNQPPSYRFADADEVRRLVVGDLDRPAYVAMPATEAKWLRAVRLTAEVLAMANHPDQVRAAQRMLLEQLDREPKTAA